MSGRGNPLRGLDERLVPAAARGLRRTLDAVVPSFLVRGPGGSTPPPAAPAAIPAPRPTPEHAVDPVPVAGAAEEPAFPAAEPAGTVRVVRLAPDDGPAPDETGELPPVPADPGAAAAESDAGAVAADEPEGLGVARYADPETVAAESDAGAERYADPETVAAEGDAGAESYGEAEGGVEAERYGDPETAEAESDGEPVSGAGRQPEVDAEPGVVGPGAAPATLADPVAADPVAAAAPSRTRERKARIPRRRPLAGLAALDARYARGGVLGFVREIPQFGFVLLFALIVAGALGAIRVDADRAAGTAPGSAGGTQSATKVPAGCPVGTASGAAFVGPAADTALPTYASDSDAVLTACAKASPDTRLFAVVSLSAADTPAAAAQDLRGVDVQQVFVQLPADAASPRVLTVTGAQDGSVQLEASIDAAYDSAQTAFLADRTEQLAQLDSITSTSAAGLAAKEDYQNAAATDALDAAQLRLRCACVYGAVAYARVADLAALRTTAIRVIALAPAGTSADGLTARPLLPAETTTLGDAAAPTPVVAGSIR